MYLKFFYEIVANQKQAFQHYIKHFEQSTSAAAYSSSSDLMTNVLVKAIILPCYTGKLLDIAICTVPTYESILERFRVTFTVNGKCQIQVKESVQLKIVQTIVIDKNNVKLLILG